MASFWQDVRYAARSVIRHRGFSIAAILTVALGIGASSAIFSVVNGVLLKPLPFSEPDRLVSLMHRGVLPQLAVMNQGPATYFAARDNQRVFEGIGAWDPLEVSITGRGDPERVEGLAVTAATLPLLRVQPALGRFFSGEDEVPGAPARVVLAYGYWQSHFGGTADVIGQSLEIDGARAEVIGVLPPSFKFLRQRPAVVLPLRPDRAARAIQFGFQALGRLKPSVTLAAANADMARWIALLPPVFEKLGMTPYVRPLAEDVIGDIRGILWTVFAAVALVLLIACTNVTNLFLVRAEARHHELAVRAALGATRTRLARVLLCESIELALAGSVLGLAFAEGMIALLQRMAPAQLPRLDEIAIDWTVLGFTLAVALVSGTLFGLVAVARFGAPRTMTLKEGGWSGAEGPARHRVRNALVVAQVAMALILMIASGLMIRTFVAMRDVDPGFIRPKEVLTFRIAIPEAFISDPLQAVALHERIAERLGQVPGVTSVGMATSITMDGENNGNPIYPESAPSAQQPARRFKSMAPGYLETMGARVVAGRSITWKDIHDRRPVVMIAATIAREYWGSPAKALGQRIRRDTGRPWAEIVGVVGDERDDGVDQPATPIVYWPIGSDNYRWRTMAYAVRSSRVTSSTRELLHELQQAVWSLNPNVPIARVETLAEIEARSMAQTSFMLVILGITATVALMLGVVGIYGVITYIATRRARETGIRLALGAQGGEVRRLYLRHGLGLTASGIAIGTVVALGLTRVISALLFGVTAVDVATYVTMSALLASVTMLATYLPARRASRIDPAIALRGDV
jgi:predicted permease